MFRILVCSLMFAGKSELLKIFGEFTIGVRNFSSTLRTSAPKVERLKDMSIF